MTDLLLGIDVGTSACKSVVVDSAGRERAHGDRDPTERRSPEQLQAFVPPEDGKAVSVLLHGTSVSAGDTCP